MKKLEKKFADTVNYVKNAKGNFKPSNELKLEMYALYKQATEGDVKGKKPGRMDLVGRTKYSAWEKTKGITPEAAMQSYIDKVEALKT